MENMKADRRHPIPPDIRKKSSTSRSLDFFIKFLIRINAFSFDDCWEWIGAIRKSDGYDTQTIRGQCFLHIEFRITISLEKYQMDSFSIIYVGTDLV